MVFFKRINANKGIKATCLHESISLINFLIQSLADSNKDQIYFTTLRQQLSLIALSLAEWCSDTILWNYFDK